jgi:glycine/D-amino acid oxidase-like deaminating enzyme
MPDEQTADRETLRRYAAKMAARGDRFMSIVQYLDSQGADESLKREIVAEIETTRKAAQERRLAAERRRKLWRTSTVASVTGLAFFAGTLYLESHGLLQPPLTLVGYAAGALSLFELTLLIVKCRTFKNKEDK